MQKLKCENCGSNDISIESEEHAICRNCGTKIMITPTTQNISVNNNISLSGSSNDSGLSYAVAKKTFNSDDFLRKFIIELGKNKDVSAEVLDYSLSPIKLSYDNYIIVKGHVDLNYTASIGYLITRKTTDGSYITQTDWKPFSGSFNNDVSCYVYNNKRICGKEVNELHRQLKQTKLEVLGVNKESGYVPLEITSDVQSKFRNYLLEVSEGEINLPGDRYRDFSYNGTTKIEKVFVYGLPKYTIKYSMGNESETYSAFAFGDKMSPLNIKSKQKFKSGFWKKRKNIVSLILSFIPTVAIGIFALLPPEQSYLAIFPSLISVIWWLFLAIRHAKFKKNAQDNNQYLKKTKCNNLLRKHGLSPLTREEERLFYSYLTK